MRIGIMGGTFNPIHSGHMEMIQKAAAAFSLDDVLLIPTGNPPHKTDEIILPKYDRYELCLLSAADYDNVFVSSVEIQRSGVTYTIDTLKELEQLYGIHDDIFFIIGGDTVVQLESWKNFREVFKRCSFIAFSREGMDSSSIQKKIEFLQNEYAAKINFISLEIQDVSSSVIRERIKKSESITGMVPPRVELHIHRHKLYSY